MSIGGPRRPVRSCTGCGFGYRGIGLCPECRSGSQARREFSLHWAGPAPTCVGPECGEQVERLRHGQWARYCSADCKGAWEAENRTVTGPARPKCGIDGCDERVRIVKLGEGPEGGKFGRLCSRHQKEGAMTTESVRPTEAAPAPLGEATTAAVPPAAAASEGDRQAAQAPRGKRKYTRRVQVPAKQPKAPRKLARARRPAPAEAKPAGHGVVSEQMGGQVVQMVTSLHASMQMMVGINSATVVLTVNRDGQVTAADPRFQG